MWRWTGCTGTYRLAGIVVLHAASIAALPAQQPTAAPVHHQKLAHTYSIVAYDSVTGDLGVAVQSKFPNVGRHRALGAAGVGAVATQSLGNTAYGERGLELIALGATAEEALRIVMRTDTMLQDRQVGMVDARGNAASFTGTRTFDWAGGRVGAPRRRQRPRREGGGDRGARLRRPGQHHGVGPDGEEPGRDLRAEPGQPGGPADGGAQGRAGRRRRQARDAVAPPSSWSGRTAATSAPTTASSTFACTTRSIRSPSWSGCSRCTSCTSSRASPRTWCRSRPRSWRSSSRSCWASR